MSFEAGLDLELIVNELGQKFERKYMSFNEAYLIGNLNQIFLFLAQSSFNASMCFFPACLDFLGPQDIQITSPTHHASYLAFYFI